jgi:hypothetical protein
MKWPVCLCAGHSSQSSLACLSSALRLIQHHDRPAVTQAGQDEPVRRGQRAVQSQACLAGSACIRHGVACPGTSASCQHDPAIPGSVSSAPTYANAASRGLACANAPASTRIALVSGPPAMPRLLMMASAATSPSLLVTKHNHGWPLRIAGLRSLRKLWSCINDRQVLDNLQWCR